ncbi:hypothetical protein NHX12_021356 [Muraenolepis orangiensis]|uniref:Uncharacterized protein n=1 Tax=Muraenolepis orangiensis TaxID=630683 RepID=A0A9Q0EPY7_9TELE|nr:hypothetical protein NHX12_021356 [Muraenolepis orangiensis]
MSNSEVGLSSKAPTSPMSMGTNVFPASKPLFSSREAQGGSVWQKQQHQLPVGSMRGLRPIWIYSPGTAGLWIIGTVLRRFSGTAAWEPKNRIPLWWPGPLDHEDVGLD